MIPSEQGSILIPGKNFIVGVYGSRFNQTIQQHLKKVRPAGIIIFERNAKSYEQLKEFISQIRDYLSDLTGTDPYICIDHEGGRINRLPFLEKIESAKEIGVLDDEKALSDWVVRLNEPLVDLGFNVNFAPCVDLFTNPDNNCLVGRCFSDDPEKVADIASLFIKCSKEMGILTCGKHFPGLGAAGKDTHDEKAVIERTDEELLSSELIPFKKAIEAGVDFIMVNHAVYPAIDILPASLSPKVIKGILREKLGFKGHIITDDLCMKGITKYFKKDDYIYKALEAGNDLLLICH